LQNIAADMLLLFAFWIIPAILNILSQAADEACTLRNFLAIAASAGNLYSLSFQNARGQRSFIGNARLAEFDNFFSITNLVMEKKYYNYYSE